MPVVDLGPVVMPVFEVEAPDGTVFVFEKYRPARVHQVSVGGRIRAVVPEVVG